MASSSSSSSTIKELDHLRIPLEEIVNATNNFADEYIIGKGGLGKVYKGRLMRSGKLVNVSVRRFDCKNGRQVGNIEFFTEISMLSSFKHYNIVSMIGFCEEGEEKIIVNSYHAKGSLMMHLSDPASFTWLQRMKLSLQVAKAILYIHCNGNEYLDSVYAQWRTIHPRWDDSEDRQEENYYAWRCYDYIIIHRNINSSTILLDEDSCPRLSGFEHSIKVSIDRKDHIYLCEPLGTHGYMDPAIFKNGGVNHKSDVYSFGVILFEILCGRKAYQNNSLLAPLAKFHYEHGTLQDIILPDLWKQMNPKSFKIFSEVAYSCLETEWTQRPDIKQVLFTLRKALKPGHTEPEENLEDVKSVLPNHKKMTENKTATWEEQLKMCIDNANKLDYLHSEMEVQKTLMHDDTNSGNIVLDDNNLGAKIAGYRDSVFHNEVYMDPEFLETGKLCKESDVFGFGVLMFEMLRGYETSELLKLMGHEKKGMASMVQTWLNKDSVKRSIDGVLLGGYGDNKLFLNKGPNEDSLSTFLKIACQCVENKRNERPTIKVVVQELEKALTFQKNYKDNFRMSFEDIELATQNFSLANVIGGGGFGKVYKGKLADTNGKGYYPIVAKKLDTRHGQGNKEFYTELQILCEYKHENIIGLIGYSNETEDKIIVYEHASKGSLDKYLNDASLTWRNRLKICVDFATGLDFLHEDVDGKHAVIHRDIKSSNILLFDDWKAKIGDFGLSMISATNSYTIDIVCGTSGYVDPLYLKSSFLTKESDIYSFGVVLFEILCGKAIYELHRYEKSSSLLSFIKHNAEEGKQDDLVFKAINEEIVPNSLAIFLSIVYRCLHDDSERRPSSKEVLKHLKKALNIQEEVGNLRMSLDDIKLSTQNFSLANEIKKGNFGCVYKGEFAHEDGQLHYTVDAKKFDTSTSQGKEQCCNEFQIFCEYKHENIISLVGYINEMDEYILVYEHATKGSLDKYLADASLVWTNRLNISIDFAIGLNFLHEGADGKEVVIHRNIKSSNILLFDDWKAKIGGFDLSSKISENTNYTIDPARNTSGYVDPVYFKSGLLTKESDIYSFGVVLFEILCGKAIYEIHGYESRRSLSSFIEHNFEEGKQDDLVFKAISEEIVPYSLATFLDIASLCLHDDRERRPSSKEVLKHLKRALNFQEHVGNFRMSIDDIKFATQNFSLANEIERGNFGSVYKGEFTNEDGTNIVLVKKFDTSIGEGKKQYYNEIQFFCEYEHENIISLLGYINEMDEKILVYEHASNRSLDKYLSDANLKWKDRLKICIEFAVGLNFLHEKAGVIQRDIKSSNILFFDDWKLKIGGFGLSSKISKNTNCTIDLTSGYVDPLYSKSGMLTIESDIYSFGVVLFEILYGKAVYEIHKHYSDSLLSFIKHNFEKRKQYDAVFKGIKEEIGSKSLTTFLNIVYKCLDDDPKKRPSSKQVLRQLKWALEFQEDYELGCCVGLIRWFIDCDL